MTQIAPREETAVPAPIGESEPLAPRPLLAAWALCRREVVRFLRQRNRIISAVGQPLLLWLLFSVGLHRAFNVGGPAEAAGGSFTEYYFPGTLMLIVLFTAIFATFSVIEDRKEGFLQAVLVAPVPRWSMVLGKVAGGSLLAVGQGLIFLLLALTLEMKAGALALAALVLLLAVSAVALNSLGLVIAWRMDSVQGFHAVMSLLLLPMWLLSGAFFPIPALTKDGTLLEIVLHWCMRLNPLTYCVAGARQLLFAPPASKEFWQPDLTLCWIVSLAFAAGAFAAACLIAARPASKDLR